MILFCSARSDGQFDATFIQIGRYLAEIFEKEGAEIRKLGVMVSLNSSPGEAVGIFGPGG